MYGFHNSTSSIQILKITQFLIRVKCINLCNSIVFISILEILNHSLTYKILLYVSYNIFVLEQT